MTTFSVIIPAFNEEAYLPATLEAVRRAEAHLGEPVEIIVGDNESTDRTAEVAREHGAKVVLVDIHCISAVRNRAAAEAQGKYLVFCDADNRMSENMLSEIKAAMDTGKYVGGGITRARYDRESRGIGLTHLIVRVAVAVNGLSMFLFYCTKDAYDAIGGFDEKLLSTEDLDFAKRLRKHGRAHGLKYKNLGGVELVMSSRKFTEYGDWAIFRHPIMFIKACFNDPNAAYELWYNPSKRG